MAGRWDREKLTQVIQQWNVDHYDLFELSAPNQDLEFHGVVRFYFQGGNGANVITKCIRVSSTASTSDVIATLIEKFRPDMRMLTQNKYALYEVHVNGEERRLLDQEKVLWVQLNWGKDVREGRFLLKNEDEKTVRDPALGFKEPAKEENPNFKRKLSKREKKEKKKREEELARQNESVSSKLYTEAPETSFTRSISNPEAVMRRRRQQKLEKKLAQMQSREGGGDSGGTLKIYGESLRPDVPYKTLLLSTADTTATVIKEAMEKYGLEKEDPEQFCLVEVMLPPGSQEYHGGSVGDERVLDEGECPLAISLQYPKHRGIIIFQLRHRSADYKRRNKRPRAVSHDDLRKAHDQRAATQADRLPYLVELNPRDGPAQKHLLPLNITEVVRDQPVTPGNQFLQLTAPDIRPQHCIMAHTEGIITLTPTVRDAEVFVEKRRIMETTMLRHGMTVQFGRHHFFKFIDPRFEEVTKKGQPTPGARNVLHQETNFDVDGHVETVTQRPGTQPRGQDGRVTPGLHSSGKTPGEQLPASLEFRIEVEDHLLKAVIQDLNSRSVQFKLAPTYVMYMAVRRLLLLPSQTAMMRTQHFQLVADFISKMSKFIQRTIQEQHNDPTSLAFWMANTSEILNMVKQDVQVQPFAANAQELLAEAVQMAFHHLVRCFQGDLQRVMPAFLDPSETFDDENTAPDQYSHGQPVLADVLNTLSAAMTLLRRCRVNAALTIQLFSQLFHFINMWLFNILVMEPQLQLCTCLWGLRLKRRLGRVEVWAEKQGLELAADCHLCRIIQAAHLLQAPKMTGDDINSITSTCFKLNSLQLRALLTRYVPEVNEPPVSPAFVERIVAIAEDMTDELTRTEGGEVRLEEDPDLHLPFLLPEDGYSCDTLRGIPDGLPEFVAPLSSAGLCHMTANNMASGSWTVYMGSQQLPLDRPPSPQSGPPEIMVVSFKKLVGSMGLSIVAAVGEGLSERGIYIKSVVPGGAAAQDGRLKAGDQLLEVDGRSLVGLSQDKAAELMTQTGSTVTLKVAKEGAVHHGLATLLNEPSPPLQRHATKMTNLGAGEEAPPPYSNPQQNLPSDSGQSRPVPQPRGQNQAPRGGLGQRGSVSEDNISSQPQHRPHTQQPQPSNFHRRDVDPRSKSTPHLNTNTSFDQDDSETCMPGGSSMGGAHPGAPGQYSPYHGNRQSPDMLHSNYENQSQRSSESGHHSIKDNFYPGGAGHNLQPQPASRRPSDRSSLSSRSSSNSGRDPRDLRDLRDPRPQSAYYDAHPPQQRDEPSNYGGRPRSVEVTANKVKEWQEKYTTHNMNIPMSQRSPRQNSLDQGHPGADPRSRPGIQPNPGYRPGESDHVGRPDHYRTEKIPGYGAENPPAQLPPHMNKTQVIPKSGANVRGPPPGRPGQAPRGNPAASHSANYANFKQVVQNRPQEAPRISARERLFGKQGGPPPAGGSSGGGSNARAVPRNEQNPAPPQENPQPPPPQDLPIKPDTKPKPAVKPKPPVAKKPLSRMLSADEGSRVMDRQQSGGSQGNQSLPSTPQGHKTPPGFPPLQPGEQNTGYNPGQQDPRYPQGQESRFGQPGPPGQPNMSRAGQHDPKGMQHDPRSMQQGVQQYARGMQPGPRGMQPNRNAQQDPSRDHQGNYALHAFPPQGNQGYGHYTTHPDTGDDFPPPPEEDLLPPPPPMEDFYDPQHDEHDRLMDHMPPPPNLPSAYDEFGQPAGAGYDRQGSSPHAPHHGMGHPADPNYQNVNYGPAGHPHRMGTPPTSSSPHNTSPAHSSPHQRSDHPAWNRGGKQPSHEGRAREQEIARLQSQSYLSLQDQDRLRRLLQEQEFQQRMKDVEEKSDYDAEDDEVERYGRIPQHEMHPGRYNESAGPPRDPGRQNMYPPQQGPPFHHPGSDPVAEERQRLEALRLGPRPQYSQEMAGSGDMRDVRNDSGRSNPLGSAFEQPHRDMDANYEYMNFPPPRHQGKQPLGRLSSSDPRSLNTQDQGYHSMPLHSSHYSEGDPTEDFPAFQASKKTVSFNTDLNTYQIRTPSHSYSSEHMSPPADVSPSSVSNDVFHMPPSQSPHPSSSRVHQGGTPNVIGAQEVYRDPRSRIEAQKAAEQNSSRDEMTDNMSFRDKMKYFRQEGGDGPPKFNSQPARPSWNSDYQSNGR